MRFLKKYSLLILIFLLALFFRTYNLSEIPVGVHVDEANIGYNVFSFLNTGKDMNSKPFGLAIDQFGDFRPSGYYFLDIPFVSTMGPTALAIRLPSAIFGALSVIAIYLLALELFSIELVALLSAFLLAILPWHINISRATSEGIVASFFIILGSFFFLKWIKGRSVLPIILALLFFVLSFFFYHSARLFVPLILPFLIVAGLSAVKFEKRKIFLAIGAFFVSIAAVVFLVNVGNGGGRASQVSFLSLPDAAANLKHQTDTDGTQNPLITRFYHNKLNFYGRAFLTSYFSHLSGDFLFVNTGLPIRYKIPWTENLYLIMLPFIIFGLAVLFSDSVREKKYLYLIPLAWLFIAPVPAGLTWEDIPNVQRASLIIPALVMASAFGFYVFINAFSGKLRTGIIAVSLLLLTYNFFYFSHSYFYHLKIEEPWYRSAASKELASVIAENQKYYDRIIMTNQRENYLLLYLFHNRIDPSLYLKLGSPKGTTRNPFSKISYRNEDCPSSSISNPMDGDYDVFKGKKLLMVEKDTCPLTKKAKLIKTIYQPDGVPAFNVVKLD